MSTAIAAAPAPTSLAERHVSPRQYAAITSAPSVSERSEPAQKRARSDGSPRSIEIGASVERSNSNGKKSPLS